MSRKLKVYNFYEPFSETFSKEADLCVRNGLVTPRDEGFAKQTQVMLLGRWYAEDVAQLEPWLEP